MSRNNNICIKPELNICSLNQHLPCNIVSAARLSRQSIMKKNYVSNSQESARMFKSDFLELFSKVHFSVPLFIYVPVIVFFTWQAFAAGNAGIFSFAAFYLLGVLVWSAAEYSLHRFVFHFVPRSAWGRRLHFILHGVHHDYPNDKGRLVMPPSVSIPLAFLFYCLFSLFLTKTHLYSFFPGFVTGYLFYDMTHYAVHHYNFKSEFWKKLKKHHMLHHYSDSDKGYGVTSPLWDKILQSDFAKKPGKHNGGAVEAGNAKEVLYH